MIYAKLNDGSNMPILGYGTYKIADQAEATRCVLQALEIGYRLIDTATFYQNEAGIGQAIRASELPRQDLFLTTKLWTDVDCREKVLRSVEDSLKKLKTDYLDLLLIHWPTAANKVVWQTMLQLRQIGVVKSVGTSNFKQHHIEEIFNDSGIKPAVNQVELHPLFQQPDLQAYCKDKDIRLQAWSPLMRSKALEIDKLAALAAKYGVSVAQLILRWDIQSGVSTIPKTTNKERMMENFSIFHFEISDDDMRAIAALDRNERQYRDPDNHGF